MRALDRIVERLDQQGLPYKWHGQDELHALCPSHPDQNPSLALRQVRERALCYCHAGCETGTVLAALSLTPADLFDNQREVTYRYADGRKVYRTPTKQFRQDVPPDATNTLYIPPGLNLDSAVTGGMDIWLPEGEQDCDVLASVRVAAVTSPMGAANWMKCDYSPLAKAKRLVIVADDDEAGMKRAGGLSAHLRKVTTADVQVVKAAEGKDASDHIMAGHGVDEFIRVIVPEDYDPANEPIIDSSMVDILPVDWLWDGIIPLGGITLLTGIGGTGKTTFATWLLAQMQKGLIQGHLFGTPVRSLWIGSEDSWSRTILPRFIVNGGIRESEMFSRFKLPKKLQGEFGTTPRLPEHIDYIERGIEMTGAQVILVDPLLSLLSPTLNSDRASDVRTALQPLNELAEKMNVAVLGVAHLNKNVQGSAENRISGSHAWRDVPRSTLAFATDEDAGVVVLTNGKNNLGPDGQSYHYRRRTVYLDIAGAPTPQSKIEFLGPTTRTADDVFAEQAAYGKGGDLKRAVIDYVVRAGRTRTVQEIIKEMEDLEGATPSAIRNAVSRLAKAGRIRRVGTGVYGPPFTPHPMDVSPSRGGSYTDTSDTDVKDSEHVSQTSRSTGTRARGDIRTHCIVCGDPLHQSLINQGLDTHPGCMPVE